MAVGSCVSRDSQLCGVKRTALAAMTAASSEAVYAELPELWGSLVGFRES